MAVVKINLVPDLVLDRRHEANVRQTALVALMAWGALVVVATLGALAFHAYESSRLTNANNTKNALNAQVNSADNVAFRTQALEVQTSLSALDQLFNHQQKQSAVTSAVAAIMPKEVSLKDLSITADQGLTIDGTAPGYASAGSMVAALKASSSNKASSIWFDQVSLGTANLSGSNVTFTVTAHYNQPSSTATPAAGTGVTP